MTRRLRNIYILKENLTNILYFCWHSIRKYNNVSYPQLNLATLFFLFFSFIGYNQTSITQDSIDVLIAKADKLKEEYNYTESLEYANIALTHAKIKDNSYSQGYIYEIIGYNHQINGEDKKAIENYEKSLSYADLSKNDYLQATMYTELADMYSRSDSTYTKAIVYYDNAYKIALQMSDSFMMIKPTLNCAELLLDKGEYDAAYIKLLKGIKYARRKGNNDYRSKANSLMARYYLIIKDNEKAKQYTEKAIQHALKDSIPERMAAAYKASAELHLLDNNYQQAYFDLDNHYKNLTKVYNEKRHREVDIANVRYSVEEYKRKVKQAEIEVVKRNSQITKWRITIVLGSIITLITLAFLISSYRNNVFRKKVNKDLLEKNNELRIARDAAEEVSALKSQFISTVSHELRTPLYGVIGLTTLLMENPTSEKKQEYLESLKFSGDYLLALINDVLQLSKIETQEIKLEKTSFNLRSLIDGIVNALQTKSKHNNNQVHVRISQEIAQTLVGDSIRISQILMNLIGNALKFTKNGNIWIDVRFLAFTNNKYTLRFIIRDDGIGIPKDKQRTIFENFAQVQNLNQDYQGTGLGLAIVEKLISLHESRVFLESEEGVGSTFYFDLVLDKAMNEEIREEEVGSAFDIGTGTSKFHVLVVDDNKINQIVTQNILKKNGHSCEIVGNGQDAINAARRGRFDLILMDINMPGMNGLEATNRIRAFDEYIPIIALTAVEEAEVKDQVIQAGMNDLIVKPYDTQQFFQVIIKNIERARYLKVS